MNQHTVERGRQSIDHPNENSHSKVSDSNGGFTILEIMIATAILVIGLMGIFALFPVAMRLGTITIEETNAVIIARSVEQAIRDGVQNRKGQTENDYHTYFLFQHDGVKDPLPSAVLNASPRADYYILFPEPDGNSRQEVERGAAYNNGKTFVYPETDGLTWTTELSGMELSEVEDTDSGASPNGGGKPLQADDDGDDIEESGSGARTYAVYRTYPLSNQFLDALGFDEDEEKIRDDDPISQYSFAFAIRPAYRDGSLSRTFPTDRTLVPSGELYEVEILVYRSFFFVKGGENVKEPILRKTVLVHR